MKRLSCKILSAILIITVFSAVATLSGAGVGNAYTDAADLPGDYLSQWFDTADFLDYEGTLSLIQSQILAKANISNYTEDPVVIAVIDTGIQYDHSVFDGLLYVNEAEIADDGLDNDGNDYADDVSGWDFVNADNDAADDCTNPHSHGTHVAGIVAKEIINYGLQDYIRILPLKAGTAGGSFSKDGSRATPDDSERVVAAVNYAVAMGADVINMSFAAKTARKGWGVDSKLDLALKAAHDAGVVLVAAAGNDGIEDTKYQYSPACLDNVIGVMNMDVDGRLQESSNYGIRYDVVAPGTNVLSSVRNNYLASDGSGVVVTDENDDRYSVKKGTSMAAPLVSFMAAVLMINYDCNADTVNYLFDNCATEYVNNLYKIASLTNYLAYKPVTEISVEVTSGGIAQKITEVSEINFILKAKYFGSDALVAPDDDIIDDVVWVIKACDASGKEIAASPAQYFYGATMAFTPSAPGNYKVYARLGKYDIGESNSVFISVDYASAEEAGLVVIGEKEDLRADATYIYNVANLDKINPSESVYWKIYHNGDYLDTISGKQLVFSPKDTGEYVIICNLTSGETIEEITLTAKVSKKTATIIGAGVGGGAALIIIIAVASVLIIRAKRKSDNDYSLENSSINLSE